MFITVEAVIDENNRVRLLQPVHLDAPRRALLTIFDDSSDWPARFEELLSRVHARINAMTPEAADIEAEITAAAGEVTHERRSRRGQ
jgi:hypothetical protein